MKLLFLYHAGFSHIPAVFHYTSAFGKYSRHEVSYFNIDDHYQTQVLNFTGFDVVFFNYDALATARHTKQFDFRPVANALRGFKGLKVVSVQDEYDNTNQLKAMLQDLGFDLVLTCVPADHVDEIYSPGEFPNTKFMTVLTGYVSDDARTIGLDSLPLSLRQTVVGYRGRELSLRLGDLGWHKAEIGRRFESACLERGVSCDIAVEENQRIYGDAWFDFLKSCRVVLGTPSGSSVFDFDGSLQARLLQQWKKVGNSLQYSDVRDWVMANKCSFDMGQISPRIFEAAACRTAMVLMYGNYSNLLTPYEHYIPVKPDYSNLDEVFFRIQDVDAMQGMVDRAYEALILNGANSYFSFVSKVDALMASLRYEREWEPGEMLLSHTTSMPLGNDPYLLARIKYLNATCYQMEAYLRGVISGTVAVHHQSNGAIALTQFDSDGQRPN